MRLVPSTPGNRRHPNPPLVLIDRWAQVAVDQPWRYAAVWAIGIGAANLGLRMLLNDLSLARNAPPAIVRGRLLGFAWVYTAQLTRSFRGQRPRPAVIRPPPGRAARLAGASADRQGQSGGT